MSLEADVSKGARAQTFLNSEVYKEAYGKVRQGIIDKWSESPVADKDGQHELRLMLKVLDDIHHNIVSVVNTGKLASKQIEEEKKAKTLAERAIQGFGSLIGR